MKSICNYMLASLFVLAAAAFVSCEQKPLRLPEAATAFLSENFPNEEIKKLEKEGSKYEVKMQSDKEFDFDCDGVWTKVNCRKEAVPAALIPEPIAQYLEANYPGAFVTEIEILGSKIEVDLSDGNDLFFTKNGEFLRIEK